MFNNRIIRFGLFVLALALGAAVGGTPQTFTGTVRTIYSQDSQKGAHSTTVYLNGVTSTSTICALDEGHVSFRIKDDENGKRQYATILAAFTYGHVVEFYVDDAYRTPNDRCYLMHVKLQKTP